MNPQDKPSLANLPTLTNMAQLHRYQIETSMQMAAQSLIDNQLRGRLPEHIFVQNFLPYFNGTVPVEQRSLVYSQWIGVAGSPMSEVELLKPNGEIAAIVPPIYDTGFVSGKHKDVNRIASEYELLSTNPINPAEDIFLSKMLNNLPESSVNLTHEQRWVELLSKYGPVTAPQSSSVDSKIVSSSSKVSGSDEELTFD